MRSLFPNRFMDALAKTILIFGSIHILILAFAGIRESVYVLNVFRILNLDWVVPALGVGVLNLVLSYAFVLVGYGIAYRWMTNPGTVARDGRRSAAPRVEE